MPIPDDAPKPKFQTFLPFSDDQLEALNVAHDDIRVVRSETPPAKSWRPSWVPEPEWEVVFRKPVGGEFSFFERHANNENARDRALRLFAKTLIVGVSFGGKITICTNRLDNKQRTDIQNAWDALCEKCPGVHLAADADIQSLSGMAKEEAGKG